MTAGKATALTAAFIGAFALGVAVGPSITEKMSKNEPARVSVEPAQPSAEPALTVPGAGREQAARSDDDGREQGDSSERSAERVDGAERVDTGVRAATSERG